MLNFVRKNTKTIIWLVVAAFILWGAGAAWNNLNRAQLYAGEIFGQGVSRADYGRVYQQVQFSLQNQKMSANQMAEETWNRLILLHEAKTHGIKVSDADVRREIENFPWLKTKDGQFSFQGYQSFIAYRFHGDSFQFESLIKDDLIIQKLVDLVVPQEISDEKLFVAYKSEKQKVNLSYVTLPFSDKIKAPDWSNEDLQKYYDAHQDDFRKPPTFKLAYLMIDPASFESEIQVTPDQIKEFYEKNKARFNKEGETPVKTFDQLKPEVEKAYKAEQAVFKAQDFTTQLASKIKLPSDLPTLASPPRVTYVTTGELSVLEILKELGWSAQLFNELQNTKMRQVSQPFRTSRGFCILSLVEKNEPYLPPLEKIKDQVASARTAQWRSEQTLKTAQDILKQAQDKHWSLAQLASANTLKVQETGLIDRFSTDWANVEAESILEDIFKAKLDDFIGPLLTKDGARIFQVSAVQEATDADFQKEKDAYRKTYLTQQKEQAFTSWFTEVIRRANRKVFELK